MNLKKNVVVLTMLVAGMATGAGLAVDPASASTHVTASPAVTPPHWIPWAGYPTAKQCADIGKELVSSTPHISAYKCTAPRSTGNPATDWLLSLYWTPQT